MSRVLKLTMTMDRSKVGGAGNWKGGGFVVKGLSLGQEFEILSTFYTSPIPFFDTLSWIGAIAFPEEIGENTGSVQVYSHQGVLYP